MAKITRYNGNFQAFASQASTQEKTVFGHTEETDSSDITANITAAFLRGWGDTPFNGVPTMQDFNAAMFTATQVLAYLHQMGVPEWNASQQYQIDSLATYNGKVYVCITANHTSATNPEADGTNWKNASGGATGKGSDQVFYENDTEVTENYTIGETSSKTQNAMTAGPVTVNAGVTVTVPAGSTWSIV